MIRVNVKFEFMCHFNDVICSALLGWLRSKRKEQVEQQRQRELTERTVVTGKFAVWAAPAERITECVRHKWRLIKEIKCNEIGRTVTRL
jgi:hypothetical protein